MGKFIITEEEKRYIRNLYEVSIEPTTGGTTNNLGWDGIFPYGTGLNDLKANVENKTIKSKDGKIFKIGQIRNNLQYLFLEATRINDVGEQISKGVLKYECVHKNLDIRGVFYYKDELQDDDDVLPSDIITSVNLAKAIETYYCKRFKPKSAPPPKPKVKIDYIGKQGQNQSSQV